jgi:hypothetical protein
LRIADRLGQHLMQLSLALLYCFVAHRSPPVTDEPMVVRPRCLARKPADYAS